MKLNPAQAKALPEAIDAVTAGVEPAPDVHMCSWYRDEYVVFIKDDSGQTTRKAILKGDGSIEAETI